MRYKKGESGNPGGRPKLPEDVVEARQLTSIEFTRIANKYLSMTKSEVAECIEDPATSVLELMIANIINKAVNHGDHTRTTFLLDRLIGKVSEKIEHSGRITSGGLSEKDIATIFSNEDLKNEARAFALKLSAQTKENENASEEGNETS